MFPTFPQFARLSLDDRESYDEFVAEFPPYSDISFTTLHIWWNLHGKLAVSMLNDNLIIDYLLPFDPKNSGYSIIGKHDIDQSLNTVLSHLKTHHKPARLVHVPEFVVKAIRHPEDFKFEEEVDYNEYILDSNALATLESSLHGRTRKEVNRFFREVEGRVLETKALDLSGQEARDQLFSAIRGWEESHPGKNDPDHTEYQAIQKTLEHAAIFDIQNLGLYIDGELQAIVLYHKTNDQQYYIVHHLKVNYSTPRIFDYMTHQIARKASDDKVPFINAEMDLGVENLRMHKMRLRPIEFFRKYTIRPA